MQNLAMGILLASEAMLKNFLLMVPGFGLSKIQDFRFLQMQMVRYMYVVNFIKPGILHLTSKSRGKEDAYRKTR